ncbi:cytochrome C oxidase assembly protein [Campylobacter sp. MIT 12-5580]|uniref:cytochrome d ubiquinol oxidase subunit II n=1 Tax=Campylobacter sp. MIT 12-5580 TaxID=2040651 RepID=UPI0010F7A218|nr:cytochrome d ubiquinol oxidase subunit II [Campylobacter sp. MIT 12-5580]TKX28516.1 cytochrome C oxidase assembly protein [Campylobacter sp. MIT 12-5580]
MFFGLELSGLQMYWWLIVSLLGGLLVFMFFVQGGQTLIDSLSKSELEKTMLVNSLGRKWELGFTTLVMFGGACFAAFPLFYSTSFGGAYWAWLAILFCFILQAVSYEYRKKAGNVYGSKTYEIFLKINGFLGVFLIGIALSSFYSGSHFSLNEHNFVQWQSPFRGLELLLNPYNYLLALALVFLSRVLGASYFMNNILDEELKLRASKAVLVNALPFLLFFVAFLGWIFTKDAFFMAENNEIVMKPFGYFLSFISCYGLFVLLFLVGLVFVVLGLWLNIFIKARCGVWNLGIGVVLVVFALLASLGMQNAFYPSLSELQSSLNIKNASSSYYTLSVMAYVSLLVPFVLAYIFYVWRAMDRVKITKEEIANDHHTY